MRIGFFTPFHLTEDKDLSMMYYHCRLRQEMKRLLREMGHELVGIATLDRDSTGRVQANPRLPGFDCVFDMRDSPPTGIVRPTKQVVQYAAQTGVDVLIRTGQDMILTDLQQACRQICHTPEDTITGAADVCSDIKGHLRSMGIEEVGETYKFVQGNWLQASTRVWVENYLRLPESIRHYCDDSVFSYLLEKDRNGRLLFTPGDEIIHKHRRNESASFFDSLLPDPELTPVRADVNLLVLYRYAGRNPDESARKLKYLRSFARQYSEFARLSRVPSRFFLIADNSPETEEHKCQMALAGLDFKFVSIKSAEQKEKLHGGQPCTPKHYTLYITSMELVKRFADSRTVVLFTEDDYLFRPDALSKIVAFLQDFRTDFVTPMDHPDRYDEPRRLKELTTHYQPYRLELLWRSGHHWRSCVSTCHTFAATLEGLRLNEQFLLNADRQRGDHTMWCELWRNGRSKLWCPIPGLASHRGGPKLDDWDWNSLLSGEGIAPVEAS